ncbi:MAG: ABC transporter ATP-binding protein [Rhodoferax sp.]|nr:ABC transporter ATP-binding protein [Rhodoferax sp.]MCP5264325.1 ABC transporter ATP-binding protein [Rhodoferax sp.]
MDAYRGSTVLAEPAPLRHEAQAQAHVQPALLELRGIAHNFRGLKVLEGVDLPVPRGGITGLIGPNGSGKTTCFNIASGFLCPAGGQVLLDGQEVTGHSPARLSRAGLVRTFQTPQLFEHMTVLENVMVGLHAATRSGWFAGMLRLPAARRELEDTRGRAAEVCERFGLSALLQAQAGTLPAGRKRVVELARAFAARPRLLLLDEPSSGLNTEEIEVLKGWIVRLHQQGMAILLVSHDMGLMAVAQRVHALYFGRIIASGSFEQVQADARVREAYLGV